MLYVDDDGNPLDESVGRCNREDNCGYHYTPSQFFKDHPDYKRDKNWRPSAVSRPHEEKPVSYLPEDVLDVLTDTTHVTSNNLAKYLLINFRADRVRRVIERYRMGTSMHWMYKEGKATVFPQIDTKGRIRQIKVMIYNPYTGRRLHEHDEALRWSSKAKRYYSDSQYSKVWFAGKAILNDQEANLQQTFFGAHLLPLHPEDTVCIVESEKTAMIMDLYMNDFCAEMSGRNADEHVTWLATGGKNGCRWTEWDVCQALRGRTVRLYPDLKCYEDWSDKADILRRYGIKVQVSHYLEDICTDEQRELGFDIADFVMDEHKRMGER